MQDICPHFVISRLDYFDVILYGFGGSEHRTPVLYYLHWLPIEWRADYEVLLKLLKHLTTMRHCIFVRLQQNINQEDN